MSLPLHTPDTIHAPRHVPSWLLLAAAAGGVNGFAFLACEQFVTHVTGTATRVGLEWPHLAIAAEYAVVLFGFIAGAVVSVVAIQARAARGKRPRWAAPLVAVALILVGVGVAGRGGMFGPVGGTTAADPPPFDLLSLLAFAMGLQNAAVASTAGLAVRTTHLTGSATDLGILLGAAYFGAGAERRSALRGAALRGGKMAAFIAGAGLAFPLTGAFDYLALLAPAALILVAAALSFVPAWSPGDYPSPAAVRPDDSRPGPIEPAP